MLAALLYVIPVLTIAVTLYTGYLGWRFYLREIVRGGDGATSDAERDAR